MKRKKVKVIYRKLGQEQALGTSCIAKNLIEIDQRLKGKKLVSCILHEALHFAFPELTEEKILEAEKVMANILWEAGVKHEVPKEL